MSDAEQTGYCMRNAHISVLLPFRDSAATLHDAVESILTQGGPTLELIAINDQSRDEGPSLIEALAQRDGRLRLLHTSTDSGGLPSALNLGLQAARGILIARMDGDDIALPGRLRRQADALQDDEMLAAVGTRVKAFPPDVVGEGMQHYIRWQNSLQTPEEHRRELFIESPLCHPSVMMRKSAIEAVGGYRDVRWAEDYDLWCRFDAAGFRMAKVPEVLLRWRHQAGRATFNHPRYSTEEMRRLRAHFLAVRLRPCARKLVIWGAGRTGRKLARALADEDCVIHAFVDVDPRKIGRQAGGISIHAIDHLHVDTHFVLSAVGNRGARAQIRTALNARAFVEGDDFLCVA